MLADESTLKYKRRLGTYIPTPPAITKENQEYMERGKYINKHWHVTDKQTRQDIFEGEDDEL